MDSTLAQKQKDFMLRNAHVVEEVNKTRKTMSWRAMVAFAVITVGVIALYISLYGAAETHHDDRVAFNWYLHGVLVVFLLGFGLWHLSHSAVNKRFKDDIVRQIAGDIHPNLAYGGDFGVLSHIALLFGNHLRTAAKDVFTRKDDEGKRVLFLWCEARFFYSRSEYFRGMVWKVRLDSGPMEGVCDYFITNRKVSFGLSLTRQRLFLIDNITTDDGETLNVYTKKADERLVIDIAPALWRLATDDYGYINVVVRSSHGVVVVAKNSREDKFGLTSDVTYDTIAKTYNQISRLHDLGMQLSAVRITPRDKQDA